MPEYLPEGKLMTASENIYYTRSEKLLNEAKRNGTILEARALTLIHISEPTRPN